MIDQSSDPASVVRRAAGYVRERCSLEPAIGLILGSGLSAIADGLAEPVSLPLAEIPGWPAPMAPGHPGSLSIGRLADRPVAVLAGRLCLHDGHTMAQIAFPVRLLSALGCRTLVVANTAFGLNPLFWSGDLMVITDHINFVGLAGHSPLAGPEAEAFGPRFVDLRDAYDPDLVELAVATGRRLGLELRRGVYALAPGPSYETPAEARMLRALGVDAVGSSAVPEVLAARQLGMRVLAISCITNLATSRSGTVTHDEGLASGLTVGPLVGSLLMGVAQLL